MSDELMKERFSLMRERIGEISQEELVKEPYRDFFVKTAQFILQITQAAGRVAGHSVPAGAGRKQSENV